MSCPAAGAMRSATHHCSAKIIGSWIAECVSTGARRGSPDTRRARPRRAGATCRKVAGREGGAVGLPRFQSRSPETTTLTVTKARIASDAKRRSSRPTRRRKPQSRASIPAIRWRRCARWTITRPAKAKPTSAWMALRMWRSCRVPSAATAQARRPRCTSQRDLVGHPAPDRGGRSAGVPAALPVALPRATPWFSASTDLSSHSGRSSRLRGPAARCSPTPPEAVATQLAESDYRDPGTVISATAAAITRRAMFQRQHAARPTTRYRRRSPSRRSAHRRPSLLYCVPAATSSPTQEIMRTPAADLRIRQGKASMSDHYDLSRRARPANACPLTMPSAVTGNR